MFCLHKIQQDLHLWPKLNFHLLLNKGQQDFPCILRRGQLGISADYFSGIQDLTFLLELEEVLQNNLEQIVTDLSASIFRVDQDNDQVQQSLPLFGWALLLPSLGLLEFFNQDIHDQSLLHVVRLGANSKYTFKILHDFILLVEGHEHVVGEELGRPLFESLHVFNFVVFQKHYQLRINANEPTGSVHDELNLWKHLFINLFFLNSSQKC